MTHAEVFDPRTRADAFTRTMPLLLAWLFVALWLGLTGMLASRTAPPVGLGLAIVLPLLAFGLDRRRGHPFFLGIARLDAPTLTVLQTFRVVGAVFLVAWGRGALPGGFALPAGIGDVAVGVTAPFIAAAVAAGKPQARRLFIAWNVFGVLDLLFAVSSGVAHSSSPLGFIASPLRTDAMAVYPFSLIPTFFVPLSLMLHIVALRGSGRSRAATN